MVRCACWLIMVGGLALMLGVLGGCEASPAVDVADVRIVDQTEQGGRVLLELDVSNPNDFPLPMPTANYTVTIEGAGTFTFDGVVPLAVMPMQASQTLTLPAAYSTATPLVGRSYRAYGHVTYDPPGEFRAFLKESGFPLPNVDFDKTGVVE